MSVFHLEDMLFLPRECGRRPPDRHTGSLGAIEQLQSLLKPVLFPPQGRFEVEQAVLGEQRRVRIDPGSPPTDLARRQTRGCGRECNPGVGAGGPRHLRDRPTAA